MKSIDYIQPNNCTLETASGAWNDMFIDILYLVGEKVGELLYETINPVFWTEKDFDIRSL